MKGDREQDVNKGDRIRVGQSSSVQLRVVSVSSESINTLSPAWVPWDLQ